MIQIIDAGKILYLSDFHAHLGAKIENGVLVSNDVYQAILASHTRDEEFFQLAIGKVSDDDLLQLFSAVILKEGWNEGVLLVEREIARRGLHVKDNTERFDL